MTAAFVTEERNGLRQAQPERLCLVPFALSLSKGLPSSGGGRPLMFFTTIILA